MKDPQTILAYEMNGKTLQPNIKFPAPSLQIKYGYKMANTSNRSSLLTTLRKSVKDRWVSRGYCISTGKHLSKYWPWKVLSNFQNTGT